MRSLLLRWAVLAGSIAIVASVWDRIDVEGGVTGYLWVAALFGVVNVLIRPIVSVLEALFDTIFKLTHWIVRLAPIAVFAVGAWFAATQSLDMVLALSKLVALMYVGMALVIGLCLLALLLMHSASWPFLRLMVEPVMVGFVTRSSEVALPIHMENLIKGGIDRRVGVQSERHASGRIRPRHGPVGRAVQRL